MRALACTLVLVFAHSGCNRLVAHYSGPVPVKPPDPVTPTLTVPPVVTQGSTNLVASVDTPVAELIYEWTVFNGVITSSGRGPSIAFTAGGEGLITYTVAVQNSAGIAANAGHAQTLVVAPLPADYAPSIITSSQVVSGRGPVAAAIANVQADAAYTWSISNGAITGPATGTHIAYTASAPGTVTLTVQASIVGTLDREVTATRDIVAVDSDHALALIAGGSGGPGYVDGPATTARLGFATDFFSTAATPIVHGPDGHIYFYETGVGALRMLAADGTMTTVAGPDPRLVGGTAMVMEGNGDAVVLVPCQLFLISGGVIAALTTPASGCFGNNGTFVDAMPISASVLGGAEQALTNDASGNLFLGDANYLIKIAANGSGTVTGASTVTILGQGTAICEDASPNKLDEVVGLTSAGSLVYLLDENQGNDALVPRILSGSAFSVAFGATCVGPNLGGFESVASVVPVTAIAGDVPANDTLYFFGFDASTGAIGLYTSEGARIAGDPQVLSLGGGNQASGWADGSGASVRFGGRLTLATESASALLIGDTENGVIRRATNVITSAATVTSIGGLPPQRGDSDAMPATSARLSHPTLTTVGRDGTIYVFDDDDNGSAQTYAKIHRIDATGMHPFVGASVGKRDGPAGLARLAYMTAMVALPNGDLLLYDNFGSFATLRTVSPSGDVTSVTGGLAGSADGAPGVASLGNNGVMAVAPDGSVVIGSGNAIRSFGTDGVLTTIAGSGAPGGDDSGPDSSFNTLVGITVAASGVIYAADLDASSAIGRLRKIEVDAQSVAVTTFTGTATTPTATIGACADVRFSALGSLITLANGDLIVADGAALKRVVHPDGADCTVSVVAGTPPYIGATPGALPAIVAHPKGLALAPNGDWIFADDAAVWRVRE